MTTLQETAHRLNHVEMVYRPGERALAGKVFQLLGMRHLRSTNTTFLTVPTATQPLEVRDGKDVVRLDATKDAALWDALRKDRLGDYLATNTDAVVLR